MISHTLAAWPFRRSIARARACCPVVAWLPRSACALARRSRRVGGDARREGEGIRLRQQAGRGCRRRPITASTESGALSYFNVAGAADGGPAGYERRARAQSRRRRRPAFRGSTPRRRRGATTFAARCWATSSRPRRSSWPRRASPTRTARRRRCRRSARTSRNTASASRGCGRSIDVHEKNVEALKKELAAVK